MNKICCALLSIVLLIGLCACGGMENLNGGSDEIDGLQVGFGRADITPDYSVHMAGGDWRNRIAKNGDCLDSLYITCVAFRENDETVLVFTMDVKLANDNFVNLAKKKISEDTGIAKDNIVMNATHTHAGVAIRYEWDNAGRYRNEFNIAASAAAQEAIADLAAVQIYAGGVQTEKMAFVRHYIKTDGTPDYSNEGGYNNPEYASHAVEADQELQLVRLDREGKKDIVLMSMPAHGTMNENSTRLSADFPAPARQHVEENTDSLVAYFIGAAGDQVPISKIAGLSYTTDYKEYGKKLGEYAVNALPNLTKTENAGLKFSTQKYRTQMDLRVMCVGNLGFIFAPYEMAGQNGLYVKENSPFDTTFVVTCSQGAWSYIPTEDAYNHNSYEAQCSLFEKGTGEKLANEFVSMLTELKNR